MQRKGIDPKGKPTGFSLAAGSLGDRNVVNRLKVEVPSGGGETSVLGPEAATLQQPLLLDPVKGDSLTPVYPRPSFSSLLSEGVRVIPQISRHYRLILS